jgi:Flavin-binding monooxygenase-like
MSLVISSRSSSCLLLLVIIWVALITTTTKFTDNDVFVVAGVDAASSSSSSSSSSDEPTCDVDDKQSSASCNDKTDDDGDGDDDEGPDRVVVIGGGPAGMGFCHALEIKRRQLLERGDFEALARLPQVTVYESAATHGGLWNVDKTAGTADGGGNMYEGLWINAPKESNEFWDYTYQDHYGVGVNLPSYMPRQAVLEYMTARVTRNTPDFFGKYMKFRTRVNHVTYDDDDEVFEVHTTDLVTGENTTAEFDKCIWAAGEFAKPKMPENLMKVFRDGNFDGRIIHSSESTSFQVDVKSKRILIIGGAWSAEDLALVAIKVGVEQVYIRLVYFICVHFFFYFESHPKTLIFVHQMFLLILVVMTAIGVPMHPLRGQKHGPTTRWNLSLTKYHSMFSVARWENHV